MKFFQRNKPAVSRANDYPQSDEVRVRHNKKTGVLAIKNGSNLFLLQGLMYAKVFVHGKDDGTFELLGTNQSNDNQVLATFGSLQAANNAADEVSRVAIGIGNDIHWVRWAVILAVAYAVMSIVIGGIKSELLKNEHQTASATSSHTQPPEVKLNKLSDEPTVGTQAEPNTQAMNIQELGRLANGGTYVFNPKIAMPTVQAPQLACDQK